jgi:hypothetical protein
LDFCFQEGYLWNKNSLYANYRINCARENVGAAAGCDLLILSLKNKIKRSQPAAAPWFGSDRA